MSEAVGVQADLAEQERALSEGVGAVVRRIDVVDVTGEQAVKFLDGQLSQDISAIATGSSAWSFVLQPQGKVVALVRVTVIGPEVVLLDTDLGFGSILVERLNRFRLRVKAELSHREVDAVSVRGPAAADLPRPAGLVLDSLWPDWPGWDQLEATDAPDGVAACSIEAWEATRIRAGLPRNGADLTDKTIPAESGLVPISASMTKGCYVGQELVARIDSRGHVNRHLRRLEVRGSVPPPGAELVHLDKPVGTVSSSAFSQLAGQPVALGYVRREVDAGAVVQVKWPEGAADATVLGAAVHGPTER